MGLEDMGLEQFAGIQENIRDRHATFEIAGREDEGLKQYYEDDAIGDPSCNCEISSVLSNKVYIKGIKKCEPDERSGCSGSSQKEIQSDNQQQSQTAFI